MNFNQITFFDGKLALQQRLLPAYRQPFFDLLAGACRGGLSVFAGQPQAGEAITTTTRLNQAKLVLARNMHIGKVHSKFYLCWQFGILDWMECGQPDALIVEANPRNLSTRLAINWMHKRQRPVIGWGLGAPALVGMFASLRRWERMNFLKQLDGIIAYSNHGADEYRAMGIANLSIIPATNAVTSRPTQPTPHRPIQPTKPLTILFVGRLQQRKRIDLLLQACARIPPPIQPRLVIVGDGPARAEFETLARQIYPRAEFTGERQSDELVSYFTQADLFVLPGSGGLAIQEAMTYGLPVIVAEGDGTQHDLVRSNNGWIIPAGDLSILIKTLQEALSDVARLRHMGAESYKIVLEEINVERMAQVFVNMLNQIRFPKNH
jgi:glycosyltransferase involved in cell wall biosynthesis